MLHRGTVLTSKQLFWQYLRHGVVRDPFPEAENFGQSVAYVAVDGTLAGLICFEDKIREDSHQVISALSKQGISVYMLSGDKESAAMNVASVVGIQLDKVISTKFCFTDVDILFWWIVPVVKQQTSVIYDIKVREWTCCRCLLPLLLLSDFKYAIYIHLRRCTGSAALSLIIEAWKYEFRW